MNLTPDNATLVEQIIKFNNENSDFDDFLTDKIHLLVNDLGGIQNVLKLCLIHPNIPNQPDDCHPSSTITQDNTDKFDINYNYNLSSITNIIHSFNSKSNNTKHGHIHSESQVINITYAEKHLSPTLHTQTSNSLSNIDIGNIDDFNINFLDSLAMNNVPSNSHQQQLKIGSTSTSPPDTYTPGTPDTPDAALHKIKTNLNSTKQSSKVVIAKNGYQFYTSAVVLQATMNNNMYFQWLGCDSASKLINTILFNKWYAIIAVIWISLFSLIAEILKIFFGTHHWVYMLARFSSAAAMVLFAVSLTFLMNITIIKITCNTFDFWFKLWNMIVWLITVLWINIETTDRNGFDLFFTATPLAIACPALFLIDAIPFPYNLKRIIVTSAGLVFLFAMFSAYFSYQDVLYNPFAKYVNFSHTTISLKSVFLGAYFNIAIFTAKPMLSDIGRRTAAWICGKCNYNYSVVLARANSRNGDADGQQYERLITIYKRAKIHWDKDCIARASTNLAAIQKSGQQTQTVVTK